MTVFNGGKYRIALDLRSGGFALLVTYGRRTIPLPQAAAKFKPLTPFLHLPSWSDGAVMLPPALLMDVKATLRGLAHSGLEVVIPPYIDALQQTGAPAGFQVLYKLDPSCQSITPQISHHAMYIGNGWFMGADRYWQIANTSLEDDQWLRRDHVEGRDILALLSQTGPDWQRRKLPYHCVTHLEQEAAVKITILHVFDDMVEFDIIWRIPETAMSQLREIPSLPGYVATGESLMPGISPQTLLHSLPSASGHFQLSGQRIPQFLRTTWPTVRGYATGHIADLDRLHTLFDSNPELILAVSNQTRDGLGVVTGTPIVCVGDIRSDAIELSRRLDAQTEYVRVGWGWLPRSSLTKLGIGPLGRMNDGTPLEPVILSPEEILKQGSERLDGPWSRIEVPMLMLPQGRTPSETAALHLAFLCKWRLPGGVISSSDEVIRACAESMLSLVGDTPTAKVLIVGAKEILGVLNTVWSTRQVMRLDGLKKDPPLPVGFRGLVAATPRAFETAPALLRTHWTIVCLLEADALLRSENSRLFLHLRGCRKSLVTGTFRGADFLSRAPAKGAVSQIFHLDSADDLEIFARYGLRDPVAPPPALPAPYQLGRRVLRPVKEPHVTEILLRGSPTPGGRTLPPRPVPVASAQLQPIPGISSIAVVLPQRKPQYDPTSEQKGQAQFVAEARRLVSYREKQVPFVPFMRLWPTYDAMTSAQRKWYFYWRGQARDGNFIPTDLSYVFLHAYELLNNVGAENARDGYEQLRHLWMGYREQYPQLDFYLADWLLDYLLINRAASEAVRAHILTLPLGARLRDPDLALAYMLDASSVVIPLALLETLCNYRFSTSKFALDGRQDLLATVIPQALARVNAHLISAQGVGIFDLIKPQTPEIIRRDLFRSAIYGGVLSPIVTMTVVPYSKHPPLRIFLTSLVKYTENRLRERDGYEGRLRGYSLESDLRAVIDAFLGFPVKPAPTAAMRAHVRTQVPDSDVVSPRPIVIDMEKVQMLQAEGIALLEKLLDGRETTDREILLASEAPVTLAPDIGPPVDDLLHGFKDQNSAAALIARLPDNERRLLDVLATYGWRVAEVVLRQMLPDVLLEPLIDQVNESALDCLGDLLIVHESSDFVIPVDLRSSLAAHLRAPSVGAPERLEHDTSRGRGPEEQAATARGLLPDWVLFSAHLAPEQREVLRGIATLSDPSAALRQIADSYGSMPHLLIDSINELALDTLGDYIIVPDSDPPVFRNEDLEAVDRIIALWANRPEIPG